MLKCEIIDQSEDYIVLNKPAGLLVHGASHLKEPTLADELLSRWPELAGIGEDPLRPGIMHRLDKSVSGLMVVARTEESFKSLKKQFQERTVKKYYTALVHGRIDRDGGEIDFPIERSVKGSKMAAKPKTIKGEKNAAGREAITVFKVIKPYINYTLLEVRIKTGRTHQIRVHLAAYGHPLVGDDLYGTKKTKTKNAKLNLDRIFLVSHRLEFSDLQGEKKSYNIDLPDNLKKFLAEEVK